MSLRLTVLCVLLAVFFTALPAAGSPCPGGMFKGIPLKGRVQVVTAFPDVKVKVVDAFPDLNVKAVEHFPDKIGMWQFVTTFPDFKVQFVEEFPDVKIRFVEQFPGLP